MWYSHTQISLARWSFINTPSVGKSPKNKGPDFPGFGQTDRTVAASSSHLHHDIRTRSRILASRVITCEGTHCLAECSGSAVRACGGRVGGRHALPSAFCSHFSAAGGGCPDRRMGPACNPQLFNTLPCTCRSQANEVSPNCKSPDHRIVSEVAAGPGRAAAAPRAR